MTKNDRIYAAAGALIILGVLMGGLVNQWWFALPAFVGASLIQDVITRPAPVKVHVKRTHRDR